MIIDRESNDPESTLEKLAGKYCNWTDDEEEATNIENVIEE